MRNNKTILITGINGFLGRHLSCFLEKEYKIYGIGKAYSDQNGVVVFSSEQLDDIKVNPDYIVMCHASVASGNYSPSESNLTYVNVELTKRITDRFSNSKFIYISTASVYKSSNIPITENTSVEPKSLYAISKKNGEEVVKSRKGLIIQLTSLFGEGMKENTLIPNFVNQALENGEITVWGDGSRKQNYIHVQTACAYISRTIDKFNSIVSSTSLILATSPKEYTNKDVAHIIADETKSSIEFINDDDSSSLIYSNIISTNLLNWAPKDNFKDQLIQYIRWKRKQF